MINKLVTFRVKDDALEEAKMLVRELVENIKLNEEDTLLYRALQYNSDPTKFIHFMTFKDEYAESQHMDSSYCKEFTEMIEPLCSELIAYQNLDRLAFYD